MHETPILLYEAIHESFPKSSDAVVMKSLYKAL